MSKRFIKMLAVVSAVAVWAVSMTSFAVNALEEPLYGYDKIITPYTTSFNFTSNGETTTYVLWEEATEYGIESIPGAGEAWKINIFVNEKGYLRGSVVREVTVNGINKLYSDPDARVVSYFPVDVDQKILEDYLLDNNISYHFDADGNISFSAWNSQREHMEFMMKLQKDTGLILAMVSLLDGGSGTIDSVVNEYPEKTLDGDANNDGQLTIADATAIVQFLGNADEYPLTEQGMINADCYNTGDGVTGKDAAAIQMIEAGLAKSFEEIETI